MSERSLLLDTCALIWLSSGASQLTERARTAIDAADMVWVSAISVWEISLKVARETLELSAPPEAWFSRVSLVLNRRSRIERHWRYLCRSGSES